MHCLLCHEKIPRLRAWTGKSEFCCDEHSELYKKQTMERLLIDESEAQNSAEGLPIPANDTSVVDHILLGVDSPERRSLESESDSGEVDELWKIADRLGASAESTEAEDDASSASDPDEDALAVLLSLAEESAVSASQPKDEPEIPQVPELSVDALAPSEPTATDATSAPEDQAIEDAPELQLDSFEDCEEEAGSLAPPELVAEFADDTAIDLAPPEPEVDQLAADVLNPPAPASLESAAQDDVPAKPKAAPVVARVAPKKAPNMKASLAMQQVEPAACLPDGGYPLKPWTDALEMAGPDRGSLLGPIEFMGLRKSSLNGTASGTFDPVVFRPTDQTAPITFPVPDPQSTEPVKHESTALEPSELMAWPGGLHIALHAAEMRFQSPTGAAAMDGAPAMPPLPSMSDELLGSVAFVTQILEPESSFILTPPEKDVITSGPVEEDSNEDYAMSAGLVQSEEADGGERNDVADLF